MGKVFRSSSRESNILDRIESSKEYARKLAISSVRDKADQLANAITMRLIENRLVETTNKNLMEEQLLDCLDKLCKINDFDVDYQISPLRGLVERPNIVSLYVTSFVLETLINHKAIVDIYGTDRDIYKCIDKQVNIII